MRTPTSAFIFSVASLLAWPAAAQQAGFEWHGALAAGQTLDVNGRIHAVAAPMGDAAVTATKTARRRNPTGASTPSRWAATSKPAR